MAEDVPNKDAYVAMVLIKGDARNTRPPIVNAYEDQILYLMTDADDTFKGRGNPDRIVIYISYKLKILSVLKTE